MTANRPLNAEAYRLRVILKIKEHFRGETLFDAGCGEGEDDRCMLEYFKNIHGSDLEPRENWKTLASDRLTFSAGNAEKLAFADNTFDTVIEKDMLHHASSPEAAIKEMCRVAKEKVIILEANRYNPIFYLHLTLMEGHQHFTQKRFKQIVASPGLPYEIKHFSARVSPINSKFFVELVNGVSDLMEKIPPYRPIIEYNLGIITKK
jgi:ubiquinone/menaquinone biosynthesis C-methylase UbiE